MRSFICFRIFIFTDNIVAESCYHKGTSHSKVLFNLILRLRKAEMKAGMKLHIIHVAGTRMISQGTDAVSRGNFLEGVMMGSNMLQFVPLNQSAMERNENLITWIESWAPPMGVRLLEPQDWYELGHGMTGGAKNDENVWIPQYTSKCNIWAPPPAVAGNAMEELVWSRHMDPYVPHIFVCPRLMTFGWRKSLLKTADTVFYIGPGSRSFWTKDMHEPLIIGLMLPFFDFPPWQLRRSPRLLELERELQKVWQNPNRNERCILRKFWEHSTFKS